MIAERAPSLLSASPLPKSAGPHAANLQPDVAMALDQGTKVVQPEWIYECQRVGRRVAEQTFEVSGNQLNKQPLRTQSGMSWSFLCMHSLLVQRSSKFLLFTASSLLGDVTRRLESVMGKSVSPGVDFTAAADIHGESPAASGMATRRSRRVPRRGLTTTNDDPPSIPISTAGDLAQPGQSLQVSSKGYLCLSKRSITGNMFNFMRL